MVAANRLVTTWQVCLQSTTCHAQGKNMARISNIYKFRVGKDHRCLKRTYKSEENARSQSCQGLKADRIGSSSSL